MGVAQSKDGYLGKLGDVLRRFFYNLSLEAQIAKDTKKAQENSIPEKFLGKEQKFIKKSVEKIRIYGYDAPLMSLQGYYDALYDALTRDIRAVSVDAIFSHNDNIGRLEELTDIPNVHILRTHDRIPKGYRVFDESAIATFDSEWIDSKWAGYENQEEKKQWHRASTQIKNGEPSTSFRNMAQGFDKVFKKCEKTGETNKHYN